MNAETAEKFLTYIERGYIAQGYKLPSDYDWARVHAERDTWNLRDISVPLARVDGVCVAWGVPMNGTGQFLNH